MLAKVKSTPVKNSKHALGLYLREIGITPLLTPEEEKALGLRIQSGDQEAVRKLVEANLRFVVKIAKKYRGYGVSLQDLINEGNLGLIEAAKRFDPSRNVKFISYAVWWIRQMMLTAISNMGHPMRLPIKINNILHRVGLTTAKKTRELKRKPTAQEIAEEVGIGVDALNSVLEVSGHTISLNKPLNHDKELVLENMVSRIGDYTMEDSMVQQSIRDLLYKALGDLAHNEERVLRLRFGFDDDNPCSLREIGDHLGLSRERVRQIQEKALEKLRRNRKTQSLIGRFHSLAAV
jgi:RNA polymerase primary sigma factor